MHGLRMCTLVCENGRSVGRAASMEGKNAAEENGQVHDTIIVATIGPTGKRKRPRAAQRPMRTRFIILHQISLVARTHLPSTERTELCTTRFASWSLSLDDRYDRTTTPLFFDCPYSTPNLHYQSYYINLPIYP